MSNDYIDCMRNESFWYWWDDDRIVLKLQYKMTDDVDVENEPPLCSDHSTLELAPEVMVLTEWGRTNRKIYY